MARADALLWSINDRLGGGRGMDLEEPSLGWVETLIEAADTGKKDDDLSDLEDMF